MIARSELVHPRVARHRGIVLDKGALLQLAQRRVQLLGGVHHDRPLPDDGLAQRLAADHQQLRAILANAGLKIEAETWREIGGETFLWVTAAAD